jgi:hypothetical protein
LLIPQVDIRFRLGAGLGPNAGRKGKAALKSKSAIIWVAFKSTQMDTSPIKAIELVGDIDEKHLLKARVPEGLPAGPVRLIVLLPEEDEAGAKWESGIAREWSAELKDSREDIYTLEDGQPVNAPR